MFIRVLSRYVLELSCFSTATGLLLTDFSPRRTFIFHINLKISLEKIFLQTMSEYFLFLFYFFFPVSTCSIFLELLIYFKKSPPTTKKDTKQETAMNLDLSYQSFFPPH